jgi:4-hydroxy-2-oxoheptanedioate aldolase
MQIKRRDLLGAGMALGVGMATQGVMGQEGQANGQARRRPMGGMFGSRMEPPVSTGVQPSTVDYNYKPRRVNKAIELWEDGQPIYYGGSGLGPGVDPYAQGVRMARTYMDAINVEMEHGALDFMQLREFMRGLVDGGPTRSGHRTPAVFVETGIIGLDAPYMRANTWVLEQFLDAGVHGIHMCHARRWEAVEVATQMAMRYPFERPGITVADNDSPSKSDTPSTGTTLKYRGLRGSAAGYAAQIWGVNGNKYNHIADLWPLNKQGEMIFGLKIEDTFCDQDVDKTIALPGISMAEWGPGDHSFWLYGLSIMPEDGSRPPDVTTRPEMVKVRQAVLDACKKNNVMFLNAGSPDPNNSAYVIQQIKDGAMVLEAPESAAIIGREYSKRKMPV